jgi:putative transposase
MCKRLDSYLTFCRNLYNNLLHLEKVTYKLDEKFIFYNELAKIIQTEKDIFSQVKQQIAKKIDRSLQRFCKLRNTKNIGFPRFKVKKHYKSWTYPQKDKGFKFDTSHLILHKIGRIKVKEHRKLQGKIKTCTIKKEIDKWYVIFCVELPDKVVKRTDKKEAGLDLGCKDFITLSTGEKVENPKYLKQTIGKISYFQSKKDTTKSIKKKNRLGRKIANLHRKVHNQREDFLHKLSRKLTKEYSVICIEDLKTQQIIDKTKEKKNLRKTILDAGWNSFIQKLTYKVEETGSKLVKVNPRNTTKMCSSCKQLVEKSLSGRIHKCSCGLTIGRDLNAALNILRLGRESLEAKLPKSLSL